MNPLSLVLFLILIGAILTVPKRWAPIPLFFGACFFTAAQSIEIATINFPPMRILVVFALIRVVAKQEFIKKWTIVDKLVLAYLCWCLFASLWESWDPGSGPIYTLGSAGTTTLFYLLVRSWCSELESIQSLIAAIGFALVPIAIAMWIERVAYYNVFSILSDSNPAPFFRNGEIRARGPFRHPILAGTVGGTSLALLIANFRYNKTSSLIGIASCVSIVLASNSSGPIVSAFLSVGFICCWPYRRHAFTAYKAAIVFYIAIDLISNRSGYGIIFQSMDFTGSSATFYRVRIIDATIARFNEWWLFGTERTSHWIPRGIGSIVADGKHIDITNQYIANAVANGLVGLVLFVLMFYYSIKNAIVYAITETKEQANYNRQFVGWCVAACTLSHAASAMSVSYFDQSSLFLWSSIALSASFKATDFSQETHKTTIQ